MIRSKFHNLVLTLFFLIIFSVPIYWVTRGEIPPQKSLIEGRTLRDFPSLSLQDFITALKQYAKGKPDMAEEIFFNQFIDRTYQKKMEMAVADQFPFRMSAIQLSKAIDRDIIQIAYALLPDQAIPTDMSSGRYIMRDGSMLIKVVSRYWNSSREIIDSRISNYQTLIDAHPDTNFYVFHIERLSYTSYHPLSQYFWNADNGQALAYFESHKPAELVLAKMTLSSLADHERFFYRTDHHWNIHGALYAYDIIHSQLKLNYPDISEPLEHSQFLTFPGISFLGSDARESFYPIEGEIFEVPDIDLPEYTLLVDGKETSYNHEADYRAGNYSIEPYTNHYGEYFGEQRALLDYEFFNGSERNLLIIASSYSRPLQPLIASHYHHTYVVDFRKYEGFSLSDFLSQYPVQDVLVIGDNVVAFEDAEWEINP